MGEKGGEKSPSHGLEKGSVHIISHKTAGERKESVEVATRERREGGREAPLRGG